jgi:hypothetical protein
MRKKKRVGGSAEIPDAWCFFIVSNMSMVDGRPGTTAAAAIL